MSNSATPLASRFPFSILARCRAAQVRNAIDQQLRDTPVRSFAILMLLAVIWGALYWLLTLVLHQLSRWELISVVANQQIFVHFFLVLAVMLTFSSAILAYGSLFGRREAGYLLAMPIPARQAICVKWIEGMLLSSWSFLLLGVPLMLAVAHNGSGVAWYYYPLFVGHFLGFIIIPSTVGVLIAWAVAMWIPRRPLAVLLWCGGVVVLGASIWIWTLLRHTDAAGADWLQRFYAQISVARQPFLPSTWSAKGIVAAMQLRAEESVLYLGVVVANGAFLTWLTVNIVGRRWGEAFNRAQQGRARAHIARGWFTEALCDVLFFYLPGRWRVMMLKDLRGFVRDAPQWTQMVIMMGLLMVYALKLQSVNLEWLPVDFGGSGFRGLLAFLNLVTVSLILATFTSRFIFPLLSLESQQLWLLGLLPIHRTAILLVKFVFSVTVTAPSALVVMGLAVFALELPAEWARLQLAVCVAVCIGLSGLAVGLGARFPVLGQRNSARIAAGFGGTFNLIASMLFVAVEMGVLAAVSLGGLGRDLPDLATARLPSALMPTLLLIGVGTAGLGLIVGGRHFARLEC